MRPESRIIVNALPIPNDPLPMEITGAAKDILSYEKHPSITEPKVERSCNDPPSQLSKTLLTHQLELHAADGSSTYQAGTVLVAPATYMSLSVTRSSIK